MPAHRWLMCALVLGGCAASPEDAPSQTGGSPIDDGSAIPTAVCEEVGQLPSSSSGKYVTIATAEDAQRYATVEYASTVVVSAPDVSLPNLRYADNIEVSTSVKTLRLPKLLWTNDVLNQTNQATFIDAPVLRQARLVQASHVHMPCLQWAEHLELNGTTGATVDLVLPSLSAGSVKITNAPGLRSVTLHAFTGELAINNAPVLETIAIERLASAINAPVVVPLSLRDAPKLTSLACKQCSTRGLSVINTG